MLGFRRCEAPICRVSRTRTVWPREYRMAVPVWGMVHLHCRPTPWQLRRLRMIAFMRQATIGFQVNTEHLRRINASLQQAIDSACNPFGLPSIPQSDLPEHELYEREWETDAHHWTPNHQDR